MGHQEVQNSSMPLGSRDQQRDTPRDQGQWRAPWATTMKDGSGPGLQTSSITSSTSVDRGQCQEKQKEEL